MVTVTVTLEANEAAALKRLCDKITHSDAMKYLYPHLAKEVRNEQAYHIINATSELCEALCDAGVSDFPWINSGRSE